MIRSNNSGLKPINDMTNGIGLIRNRFTAHEFVRKCGIRPMAPNRPNPFAAKPACDPRSVVLPVPSLPRSDKLAGCTYERQFTP